MTRAKRKDTSSRVGTPRSDYRREAQSMIPQPSTVKTACPMHKGDACPHCDVGEDGKATGYRVYTREAWEARKVEAQARLKKAARVTMNAPIGTYDGEE